MEKRDMCIKFLKSECDLRENCKYGHIIVPDKEVYLKMFESKLINNGMIDNYDLDIRFTTIIDKSGKSIVMSKCQICEKGISFDENKIKKGELQSYTCADCIIDSQIKKTHRE